MPIQAACRLRRDSTSICVLHKGVIVKKFNPNFKQAYAIACKIPTIIDKEKKRKAILKWCEAAKIAINKKG